MRFLIDAQLPVALAGWIISRGYRAEHVADPGLLSASDQEIWNAALTASATLIARLDAVWDKVTGGLEAGARVVEASGS